MTLAGEGWRAALGGFFLAFTLACVVFSLLVLCYVHYSNRKQAVFPERSMTMLILSSCCGIFNTMWYCILEMNGLDSIPCWVWFWCSGLASPFLCGSFLVNGLRLVLMWRYEHLKVNTRSSTLTPIQMIQLQRAKSICSDGNLFIGWLIHMVLVITVQLPLFYTDPYWSTGDYGCRVRNQNG